MTELKDMTPKELRKARQAVTEEMKQFQELRDLLPKKGNRKLRRQYNNEIMKLARKRNQI